MKPFFFAFTLGLFSIGPIQAQSPAPVIVQAVAAAPAPAASAKVATAAVPSATDSQATMSLLQEMQTANLETLKKQEAALQTLDALQKAADEIKIYSKRG